MINPFAPSRDSLVRQQVPQWMRSAQRPEVTLQEGSWFPVKPVAQRESAHYASPQTARLRRAPRPLSA